jgi:hypothetical protein
MSSPDQEHENELAELLREVRSLREAIDQLSAGPRLPPAMARGYEVLVRSQPALPPDYEVAVRQQFPVDWGVMVQAQLPFLTASYAVLVQPPVIPEDGDPQVADE